MNKYFCTCGQTFSDEAQKELHLHFNKVNHFISKRSLHHRIIATIIGNSYRKLHFIGAYILYFTILNHFNIHPSFTEACLMGFGLGLYVI